MHCDPFTDEQIPVVLSRLGRRDAALFALGISTGLRISEILQIRRRDLVEEGGGIRNRVTVYHTKGDRKRTVPINALAMPYLREWLMHQQQVGIEVGRFPVFSRSGPHPVTRGYVWKIIRQASRGLRPAWGGAFGTHSMRKTYAREIYLYWQQRLMAGERVEPLVKVQAALGHARIDSTRHYLSFMLGDVEEGAFAIYAGLRDGLQNAEHSINGHESNSCGPQHTPAYIR